MSSSYPSFGNAPARPCQRCGRPLPPNEVYCGNCGQYNAIQLNNAVAQPSSGSSWGVAPPQTSYSSDQNEGFQWGQPPVQAPQNNPISGYSVPQQPFGPSNQPGNLYGTSAQQSNTDNFYEAPGQPARPSNFYSAPQAPFGSQQAPFGPQPSSQPMTTGFQPGTMNGYQFAGFPQAPARGHEIEEIAVPPEIALFPEMLFRVSFFDRLGKLAQEICASTGSSPDPNRIGAHPDDP